MVERKNCPPKEIREDKKELSNTVLYESKIVTKKIMFEGEIFVH